MDFSRLTINRIRKETDRFSILEFEDGHGIAYEAGQYLTLVMQSGSEEIRRSYSIISAPGLDEPLAIGVQRIDNGFFSRMLADRAKAGDQLTTTGAGGFFTLPENSASYQQAFFFAAGSGITPVYSLIKTAVHFHPHLHVVLIYSSASQERTIFYEEIKNLHLLFNDRFKLQFLFSNHPRLAEARLNKESLALLLKQYAKAGLEQTLFYICGPEAYMRMCTYGLQEAGLAQARIRTENFAIGPKPARKCWRDFSNM